MLAVMEPVLIVGLVITSLGFALSLAVALGRGREIAAARAAAARSARESAAADPGPSGDLPTVVRRLRGRLDAAEFELDQQVRSASYFADLMGVGIIRLDDRGIVELANAAAHLLLRRPPDALRGRTTIETFVDRRIEELIETARSTGSASGEYRLGGADGATVMVRARRAPLRGVWVVMEDVSELRRLQQIRTEFVDNLSHELRTPLSTVSLLAETLARDAEAAGEGVPPKMRDRIGKIEVETGHLVQMVNELLDLARIEGGGPPVLLDNVDLGRVARDAADRLRLFADRQGLRLIVDVPAEVPPVRGDEARLGQVVVNLVHNALKFGRPDLAGDGETDDGRDGPSGRSEETETRPVTIEDVERPPEVRVAVRAEDGNVILTVHDHGAGIPKAEQGRIFERFYKVDRVRVRGGGTGLGLAIARHVVGQHGGRIQVESEEGRGSTFTVTLPAAPSPSTPMV